ncbi:MAG: copper resistance CopC family protein [Candidatus Promineifilaceae bacterium]
MKKLFLFVLILLLVLWPAKRLLAHAQLLAAVPAPGSTLTEQPEEIRLTFNEAIGPGSSVTLYAEGFQEVAGVTSAVDPDAGEQLVAAVPRLDAGTYSVQWVALSKDGHPAGGSYSFAVSEAAVAGFPVVVVVGIIAAVVVLGLGVWVIKRRP